MDLTMIINTIQLFIKGGFITFIFHLIYGMCKEKIEFVKENKTRYAHKINYIFCNVQSDNMECCIIINIFFHVFGIIWNSKYKTRSFRLFQHN